VIHRLASLIYRFRLASFAVAILGVLWLLPKIDLAALDDDLTTWLSTDDPIYQTYERFRKEFGEQQPILIAIQSDHLFTPEVLRFVRTVTDDLQRVDTVQRVDSLATANVVETLPSDPTTGEPGGIDVRALLDRRHDDQAGAERVRRRVLGDPLFRGDLVSDDGRVTAIVVTVDDRRFDPVRSTVLSKIHRVVEEHRPTDVRVFYNGDPEITDALAHISVNDAAVMTPLIVLLTVLGIYGMFRSWRLTLLLVVASLISMVWCVGLFFALGFRFNIVASMLPPLVLILAVTDDVHIVQQFETEFRRHRDGRRAFVATIEHLFVPLLGASGTTALGLVSLATSNVVAVRTFGIASALGVMVDLILSLCVVPTLLLWMRGRAVVPERTERPVAFMQRLSRFSIRHAAPVLTVTVGVMLVAGIGILRLQVDTNQQNFFAPDHPLHESAKVFDEELSGVYSFNILLEGEPDSMKAPDTLRRIEHLRRELTGLPFVKKVVSVADYVKRVNRELHDGDQAAYVVPERADAIAQELFVFGLSDDGRRELERVVSTDFSRAQISVKLASLSSDQVFAQISRADALAQTAFAGSGVTPTVTGGGQVFSTLDHYLVTSQFSSFGLAFATVFAVVVLLFRSVPFGIIGVVANALPAVAVLGVMGWTGISLNVATVMVASVALGIVDDDTIHFIGRFKKETEAGLSAEEAIEVATAHEGWASLIATVINSVAYGVLVLSSYRPSAWFGGLLALTMVIALLAEVFAVPAIIMLAPRWFEPRRAASRLESAA
jgi:predicted RND superfamily exporter protein